MDKATDNIIQSPAAERMLQMVTKDFYGRAYIAQWMFEAIGREYDEVTRYARELRYEIHPQTCTWSISIWEWVYGFEPDDALPLDYRRQRILAHIIGDAPINPEVIRRGVAAYTGAEVEIRENVAPYTFEVVINPSDKPLNYLGVRRYVRRIKPSHLSFDVFLETPVTISIMIETGYNLLGYGLTGTYYCGTRPWPNIRAELRDVAVTIEAAGQPAVFDFTLAGTKPQPNIRFTQDALTVSPEIVGDAYNVPYPLTSEAMNAGTKPQTNVLGAIADAVVGADITGAGVKFPYDLAGTKPQPSTRFTATETTLGADINAKGFVFPFEITGTKPAPNIRLNAAGGGLSPVIEAEGFTVIFRMCGTKYTGQ